MEFTLPEGLFFIPHKTIMEECSATTSIFFGFSIQTVSLSNRSDPFTYGRSRFTFCLEEFPF